MSYYALIASVSARARLREREVIKELATKSVGRGRVQPVWDLRLFMQGAKCK